MSNNQETFASAVIEPCTEVKTGTVLISTNNNKSCQVVISEGKIVAVSMGRIKGYEAILEVQKVGVKGASFNDKVKFPYTDDAIIESSDAVLEELGYAAPKNTNVLEDLLNPSEDEKVIEGDGPSENASSVKENQQMLKDLLDNSSELTQEEIDLKHDEQLLNDLLNPLK